MSVGEPIIDLNDEIVISGPTTKDVAAGIVSVLTKARRNVVECYFRVSTMNEFRKGHAYIELPKDVRFNQEIGVYVHYPPWLPVVWVSPKAFNVQAYREIKRCVTTPNMQSHNALYYRGDRGEWATFADFLPTNCRESNCRSPSWTPTGKVLPKAISHDDLGDDYYWGTTLPAEIQPWCNDAISKVYARNWELLHLEHYSGKESSFFKLVSQECSKVPKAIRNPRIYVGKHLSTAISTQEDPLGVVTIASKGMRATMDWT